MNLNKNWLCRLTQSRTWRYFTKVGVVTITYCLGAILAARIQGVSIFAASVWPPAGIAQALLLLLGVRCWPGIVLGTLLFDIIDPHETVFILSLGGISGAALQAIFAANWLARLSFRPSLDRLKEVVKLVIVGAVLATQISCTLGVLSLCIAGKVDWNQYWRMRWDWWLGDTMGVLIFTPLLLIFSRKSSFINQQQLSRKQIIQKRAWSAVWLILLVAVSWLVFGSKTGSSFSRYPLEYLPFPLIIWAAIQLGQRGAILASLIVSSIAIWGGSQGGGPFVTKAESISQGILFLQAFMGVITVTSLFLAATVSERASAENSLRQSEMKYRELVENANSIIVRIDTQGNITFFNEFAQRFFGYSESEVLGQKAIGKIIPQTDMSGNDLAVMMSEILNYPEQFTRHENENILRNGERVWVSWANKALVNAEGKFIGMLCIGTDSTQRRQAELALKKLNEELESRVEERTNTLKLTLEALQYQQEQSERLLLNILPKIIADRLRQGATTIADSLPDVTVLFADIVGFTQLSIQMSPSELVELLNKIFSAFDQLAEKHGLEKIKTIGDAYMVVGGLPMCRSDHAEAIADMALDMQQEITQFRTPSGEGFRIRIGINSGPVVAGVIGIKKFIYDLWGDTVNTASRMESHGLPGCIQVTAETYERLRDKYSFEHRGTIQVKGKGEMSTYLLTGRKPLSPIAYCLSPPPS